MTFLRTERVFFWPANQPGSFFLSFFFLLWRSHTSPPPCHFPHGCAEIIPPGICLISLRTSGNPAICWSVRRLSPPHLTARLPVLVPQMDARTLIRLLKKGCPTSAQMQRNLYRVLFYNYFLAHFFTAPAPGRTTNRTLHKQKRVDWCSFSFNNRFFSTIIKVKRVQRRQGGKRWDCFRCAHWLFWGWFSFQK